MKRLWTPWRMPFIASKKKGGCVFCNIIRMGEDEISNLIIWRTEHAYICMNRFPYTTGHLLVVANAHRASLEQLDPASRAEMMELTIKCLSVLRKVYSPDGFNFGANIGAAAGAGIPDHAHLHVVPRWVGDSSFMSILGETRVLPEELEEGCGRIRDAWREMNP